MPKACTPLSFENRQTIFVRTRCAALSKITPKVQRATLLFMLLAMGGACSSTGSPTDGNGGTAGTGATGGTGNASGQGSGTGGTNAGGAGAGGTNAGGAGTGGTSAGGASAGGTNAGGQSGTTGSFAGM